jgi:S-methyl-5-thioribulose 1-phosphate isomerase
VHPALQVIYHVRGDARSIEDRARAIAVEQSIELPPSAVDDDFVRTEIVGRVEAIHELENGRYELRIALAGETIGADAGQLINMLFGNTSLHDDVVLHDVEFPGAMLDRFTGPRHGLHGLRGRVGADARALTSSALKPQGLPAVKLADLAQRLAEGGIDYVKDDHGLADQAYSPFAARVEAVSTAVRALGRPTRYVPSLCGDLDQMRQQIEVARAAGLDTVMAAPMIMGFANFHRLVRDNADIAFLAHPTMAGASRIAPALLLGKLFRMLGADAVIFPNHGGRFGYSPDTCRRIARTALAAQGDLRPCVPVPAGGMSTDRVGEMLDFYRADVMLLIGGGLLSARDKLVRETKAFVAAVHGYDYGRESQG